MMNRRGFLSSLLVGAAALATVSVFGISLAGCGVALAAWITMALNLIGTVLPTLPGIINSFSTLFGHSIITAEQQAKLTAVFQGVQGLFQQAEEAVTQFQATNDPTLVTKVQDIITQIRTRLSTVLTDAQITNAAAVAKVSGIVSAFLDLATNILTILPAVTNGKVMARRISKAQMAKITPEQWAADFNSRISRPSGDEKVDAAFAPVKAVPKH